MAVVFGGVLLCSVGLQLLFSPVGNAVLRTVDSRPVTLTGTVDFQGSDVSRLVFRDGHKVYVIANQARAKGFSGRKVRLTGTLYETAGLLDIRSIAPAGSGPALSR